MAGVPGFQAGGLCPPPRMNFFFTLTAHISPMRRGPDNSRDSRRSRCILFPAPRRGAAVPTASGGLPIPGRPRGRGRRNCRSRSRSAPSSDPADLVQEIIQRVLDRFLRVLRRAEKIDLEFAFHKMHQLLVALAQMLVAEGRVAEPGPIGEDAR